MRHYPQRIWLCFYLVNINEGGEDEDLGIEFGDMGEVPVSDKEASEEDSEEDEDSDEGDSEEDLRPKLQKNLQNKHRHQQRRTGKETAGAEIDDVMTIILPFQYLQANIFAVYSRK